MKNQNIEQLLSSDELRAVNFAPGQKAVLEIKDQSRFGGKNPFPNGTEVMVVSFDAIHYGRTSNFGLMPGLYYNPKYLTVRDASGKTAIVPENCLRHLHGLEKEPTLVKRSSFWKQDLPPTLFWEMDKVLTRNREEMTVVHVDYASIGNFRANGESLLTYRCTMEGLGNITYAESEIQLMERGNVWRRGHGLEMKFADIDEEAAFYLQVSEIIELVNPVTGDYGWTLEQALEAIQNGDADCFSHGIDARTSLYSSIPVKLLNEEAGERIRSTCLQRCDLADHRAAISRADVETPIPSRGMR